MQDTEMNSRWHRRGAIRNRIHPRHATAAFPNLLSAAISLVLAVLVNAPPSVLSATRSPKQLVVPAWSRFERVLLSSVEYTNAPQEADLTAVFTSPTGERRIVNGFWDGGRVWRVRFSPDSPGQWTFTTVCSDSKNGGLDGQTGKFLCTAPVGESVFRQHGPVRVSRDRSHFEHADGSPFFWLADTAGAGGAVSSSRDWQRYASIRCSQLFNVAVWGLGLGQNAGPDSALEGFPERIKINPHFFQQLDSKIDTLSHEGILSAIEPLPLRTGGPGGLGLPDDQTALLLRYLIARWDCEPVAWLIGSPGDGPENDRWHNVCAAAFTNSVHAPVVFYAGRAPEDLRNQKWVDALALDASTGDSRDQAAAVGGPGQGNADRAPLPVVLFMARENGFVANSQTRVQSDQVRHAAYEGLFRRRPAGITYAAEGVADWDRTADNTPAAGLGAGMPLWEKSLFLPGAKQMRYLANLVNSIDFWRLRPEPDALPGPSHVPAAERAVAAVSRSPKDLTLVYLPQSNPVEVSLQAMPPSPLISWLEPRQGFSRSAVAVVSGSVCQFPPPGEGDWVLVIRSGK